MSHLLHLLNRLKGEARVDFLTDSQHAAATSVYTYWKMPERVNLVGARGAGKTFLGWVLSRTYNAVFVSSPTAFLENRLNLAPFLVVDNVPSDERQLRTLLAELQLQQVRNALLISCEPNQVGFPVVELGLPTHEDIHVVYHNLSLLEHYAPEPLTKGNLWHVVYSTLTISNRRGAK